MASDLQALLDGLRDSERRSILATRDRALLALGWAGALRRSELVGLDWQKKGDGQGFVAVEERGVTITLATSKASQTEAVTIVIPRVDMPTAAEALDAWATTAALEPGSPVFRYVDQHSRIAGERLSAASVSRIVKARVAKLARGRGKTKEEAAEIVSIFSGHSLRAGYATSAAAKDVPSYRIRKQTRHKSAETLEGYIREAEQWTKNGLKGVGF